MNMYSVWLATHFVMLKHGFIECNFGKKEYDVKEHQKRNFSLKLITYFFQTAMLEKKKC